MGLRVNAEEDGRRAHIVNFAQAMLTEINKADDEDVAMVFWDKKYGQESGKIRLLRVFNVSGLFWSVFGVLEARDPFKKLPGGDTLQFHRI